MAIHKIQDYLVSLVALICQFNSIYCILSHHSLTKIIIQLFNCPPLHPVKLNGHLVTDSLLRFALLVGNSFSSHVKSAVTPKMVATMRVALLVYCELNGTLHLIVFYSLSIGPPSSKFCSSDGSSATPQFQSCPSEGARTCEAYCTSWSVVSRHPDVNFTCWSTEFPCTTSSCFSACQNKFGEWGEILNEINLQLIILIRYLP